MTVSINFKTAANQGVILITNHNSDLKAARIDAMDYLAKRYGYNIKVSQAKKARKTSEFKPYTYRLVDFDMPIENVFVKYN